MHIHVRISICLSVYLPAYLPVCLCVCDVHLSSGVVAKIWGDLNSVSDVKKRTMAAMAILRYFSMLKQ